MRRPIHFRSLTPGPFASFLLACALLWPTHRCSGCFDLIHSLIQPARQSGIFYLQFGGRPGFGHPQITSNFFTGCDEVNTGCAHIRYTGCAAQEAQKLIFISYRTIFPYLISLKNIFHRIICEAGVGLLGVFVRFFWRGRKIAGRSPQR